MTKNKIALVTGGSRGLGRDMVHALMNQNIDVVFTYHTHKNKAEEVLQEVKQLKARAIALRLDTRDIHSFPSFYEGLRHTLKKEWDSENIDFLINNAGTGIYTPFRETTEEQFDEMMHIHLKGVYFLTQKGLSLMNDHGGIVNISSGLARFSLPGSSAYASMKGAVEVFTRYLAKELGPRGIRANVVAPGAIATDFGNGTNRDNEQKRTIIASNTALGRVGEAEDVGGVVAFLCSDAARWVNAQRIEVSGGMLV
jgi:NAD(P)-dependent dehydrogenase (short-subunit alcohol dehydrogenase family)